MLHYPFKPKSTAYMKAGQFWPIPLSNGNFACGRVLQIARECGDNRTKTFLAGLMDWSGETEPNSDEIAGKQILASGGAHVKTITQTGASITGIRELYEDDLVVPFALDQSPGRNCRLRRGYELLGIATPEEQNTLSVFSTWGYGVIVLLAEKHFSAE